MWLVGNGEIYNHEDVRQTFDGRIFTTRSDNEVALHLISERGVGVIDELSGMYAFLAASTDGRFIAARDPVGIKPLYWARREGEIRFASEMRAFDAGWLPLVEFFPPGHYWTPDERLVRFERAVPASSLKRYPGPDSPDAPMPDDSVRPTRAPRLFDDTSSMLLNLGLGRCDAVVYDLPALATMKARAPRRYGDVAGLIRTGERYGAVLPKGSALTGPVNAALTAMRRDGTIARLQRPWLELNLSSVKVFSTRS